MAFSAEELLDVVDIDDRVIGQLTRGEIHARGLMHRAVHVLLYNSRGLLFVQKRSELKDINPGLWDTSAAGHVDAGEVPLDAAVRELREELGVTVATSALEPLGRLGPDPDTGNEFIQIYRAVSDVELTLEVGEIDDGRWHDMLELRVQVAGSPDRFTSVFQRILALVES